MDIFAEIKPGLAHSVGEICAETNTAQAMGSGSLPVYATPAMTALMERAAAELLAALLPPALTSVGTALEVRHISATPCGLRVRASARILAVDGRSIRFEVTASDEAGEIGHGSHTRFLVERERFLQKAAGKLDFH